MQLSIGAGLKLYIFAKSENNYLLHKQPWHVPTFASGFHSFVVFEI